jgi:hypothetical protein
MHLSKIVSKSGINDTYNIQEGIYCLAHKCASVPQASRRIPTMVSSCAVTCSASENIGCDAILYPVHHRKDDTVRRRIQGSRSRKLAKFRGSGAVCTVVHSRYEEQTIERVQVGHRECTGDEVV